MELHQINIYIKNSSTLKRQINTQILNNFNRNYKKISNFQILMFKTEILYIKISLNNKLNNIILKYINVNNAIQKNIKRIFH